MHTEQNPLKTPGWWQADKSLPPMLVLGQVATRQLEALLGAVFDSLYDAVFDEASEGDTELSGQGLAVLREVKNQQTSMSDRFCADIAGDFQSMVNGARIIPLSSYAGQRGKSVSAGISLAEIQRAVQAAELRWRAEIQLFEKALKTPAVRGDCRKTLNPLSPERLADAFCRVLHEDRSMDQHTRTQLFAAFDRRLLQAMQPVFAAVFDVVDGDVEFKAGAALRKSIATQREDWQRSTVCSEPAPSGSKRQLSGLSPAASDAAKVRQLTSRFRAGGLKLPLFTAEVEGSSVELVPPSAQETRSRGETVTGRLPRYLLVLAVTAMLAVAAFQLQGTDVTAVALVAATPPAVDASGTNVEKPLVPTPTVDRPGTDTVATTDAINDQQQQLTDRADESPRLSEPPLPRSLPADVSVLVPLPMNPVIDSLLRRGDTALAELRLTVPAEDSAYENYAAVLVMDAENKAAQAGLQGIIAAYLDLANAALARRQTQTAALYLERAQLVQANPPALAAQQRQ